MRCTFNKETALKADTPSRIETSGLYIGIFKQCIERKGAEQTVWFDFLFENRKHETCWTSLLAQKRDGGEGYGFGIIQAMGLLMGGNGLDETQVTTKNMFGDTVTTIGHPELCNKPIGLVLERNKTNKHYPNGEIQSYVSMVIRKAFDPKTGQTYGEKDKGKEPKVIKQIMQNLREEVVTDKDVNSDGTIRNNRNGSNGSSNGGYNSGNGNNGYSASNPYANQSQQTPQYQQNQPYQPAQQNGYNGYPQQNGYNNQPAQNNGYGQAQNQNDDPFPDDEDVPF